MRRELTGIALLLFAVFLGGVLATQGLAELRYGGDVRTSFGVFGKLLGAPLLALLGWAGAPFVPLVPGVHALRLFGRMEESTDRSWLVFLIGIAFLLPVAAGLAMSVGAEESRIAGLWGAAAAFYMSRWFGGVGAWLVFACLTSILTAATLQWNPLRVLLRRTDATIAEPGAEAGVSTEEPGKRRRRKKSDDEEAGTLATSLEPTPDEFAAIDPSLGADEVLLEGDAQTRGGRRARKKTKAERDDEIVAAIEAAHEPAAESDELPPTDLLTSPPPRSADLGKRELDAMGLKLKEALRTFNVEAEIAGRTTGPVVTQFEVEPAPGVKVRQIANLANDLALAMRAASIRVVAPIPGRGAVGAAGGRTPPRDSHQLDVLSRGAHPVAHRPAARRPRNAGRNLNRPSRASDAGNVARSPERTPTRRCPAGSADLPCGRGGKKRGPRISPRPSWRVLSRRRCRA